MATFAMIHGFGDTGWYWHLVEQELRRRGYDSRAAAELFVTPAAVSRQIRALEKFLGVALFERVHGGLELTPEGARYLARMVGHSPAVPRPTPGYDPSADALGCGAPSP